VTIIEEYSGGRRRVCNARFYNAKMTSRCRCICGGKNHAVGELRAIQNVMDMFLGKDQQEGLEARSN
jgi:hypothetical protein